MAIADELRELASLWHSGELPPFGSDALIVIADRIDAEHLNRMRQCRRETKRATAKYLRAIIEEYCVHSVKRKPRDGYLVDEPMV